MSVVVQCNICLGVFEPDRSAEWVRLTKVRPGAAQSLFGPIGEEKHAILCPACAGPLMVLLGEKRRAAEQQEDRQPAPAPMGGVTDALEQVMQQQIAAAKERHWREAERLADARPGPPRVTDVSVCLSCHMKPCVCQNVQDPLDPYKEK